MPFRLQYLRSACSLGIHRFLDLLFPRRCLFCESDLSNLASSSTPDSSTLLCRVCIEKIAPPMEMQCKSCGAAIEIAYAPSDEQCYHCRNDRWRFEEVVSLGSYHNLHDAILQMKTPAYQSLARALGELLYSRSEDRLRSWKSDLIVPVPVHRRLSTKERRGSAATLATTLARRMNLPARLNLLFFRQNLRRQSSLLPTERRRNVRGTLQLTRGYDIKGARALLVDDVLTTGATAHEAARVLLEAGAERVDVVVFARGGISKE